jgi:hypothetical protein
VVRADCSASALQTKGSKGILGTSANVVLRVQDLVSVFDGKKLQADSEIAAVVDKAQLKLKTARAAAAAGTAASAPAPGQALKKQQPGAASLGDIGRATFSALQSMLPSKAVTSGAAKGRKLLSPSAAFAGSEGAALLIENGLLLVPAAAGVEIEVSPDSGTGLLAPAEASLSLKTDDSGAASFTVQSGTHAGKLVLRYKVVKNTEALDIKPEGVVEILIQPGLDDADPAVETPVTLTRNIQVKLVPEFMPLWSGLPYFRERIRIEPGVLPGARPDRARHRSEADRPREPEPGPEARRRPAESIDIGGEWHSNVPGAFLVKQEGEKFTWEGIDLRQTGRGSIAGRRLEASWEGAPKSGRAEGEVVEATDEGWAFRIRWSNGMEFFREPRTQSGEKPPPPRPKEEPENPPRGEPQPPPPEEPQPPRREEPPPQPPREPERQPGEEPQPPRREEPQPPPGEPRPQPQQQPVDVSGRWTSNMRVVYQVRQEGSNFTLQVSGQSQAHQGTINGRALQSSWPGRPASEKVTGEVVQVSDKGRALVIRWSNGIEFKR